MQFIGIVALMFAMRFFVASVSYIIDYAKARNWEQVPAKLLEVTLIEPSEVPEFEEPWLKLRYQYTYADETYQSDQLSLLGSSPYPRAVHAATVTRLSESLAENSSVDCFINPHHLERAVLNRNFIVGEFSRLVTFLLLASTAGYFALLLPTKEISHRQRIALLKTTLRDQPWKWRPDWVSGKIRSISRLDSQILVGLALIYLLVYLPLQLFGRLEQGQTFFDWTGIILLVLGWGAINLIRIRLWSHRRFDGSIFQLAGETGIIGGPLVGSILIPTKFPNDQPLRLSLECVRIRLIGAESNDGEKRFEEDVLWREAKLLARTLESEQPGTTLVPVYFAIPFDCLPSRPHDEESIQWFLKIGPDGGESLAEYAIFEVPVFKTPQSSADFQANPEVMAKFEIPTTLQAILDRAGCTIQNSPSETVIRFSLFRRTLLLQSLALTGTLVAITAALFYYLNSYYALFALLPGVFAIVVVLATLNILLWTSEMQSNDLEITALAGLWGFRKRLSVTRDIIAFIDTDVEYAMSERSKYLVRLNALIPVEDEVFNDDRERAEDGQHDSSDTNELEEEFRHEKLVISRELLSQRESELVGEWLTKQLKLSPPPPMASDLR